MISRICMVFPFCMTAGSLSSWVRPQITKRSSAFSCLCSSRAAFPKRIPAPLTSVWQRKRTTAILKRGCLPPRRPLPHQLPRTRFPRMRRLPARILPVLLLPVMPPPLRLRLPGDRCGLHFQGACAILETGFFRLASGKTECRVFFPIPKFFIEFTCKTWYSNVILF